MSWLADLEERSRLTEAEVEILLAASREEDRIRCRVNERRYKRTKKGKRVHQVAYAKWRRAHPEKSRAARRGADRRKNLRRYGLTPEGHAAMFAAQGACCAACSGENPRSKKGWATDHDHRTGAVRGILCTPCNVALGFTEDDERKLAQLIAYIRRHRQPTTMPAHDIPWMLPGPC